MRPRLLADPHPGPPPPVTLPLHRVPEAERLRVRRERRVPNRGNLSAVGRPLDPALRLHQTDQRREDDGLLLLQDVRRTNHASGARGQRGGAGHLHHQGWRAQGTKLQGSRTHVREERRRGDSSGGAVVGDVTSAGEPRQMKRTQGSRTAAMMRPGRMEGQ